MKRLILASFLGIAACLGVSAESALEKMVDAEHAFAAMAAEKGNKAAFLAYMTEDALGFSPERGSAKASWTARKESFALLSWAPNYADMSSDGSVGYTTGNWEWRPKKGDEARAFGDFITIWVRQTDGTYKWPIDIGVSHDKPAAYSDKWITAATPKMISARVFPFKGVDSSFWAMVGKDGLAAAYKKYASTEIRSYREDKAAILGRDAAVTVAATEKGLLRMSGERVEQAGSDIVGVVSTYERVDVGKVIEKGNVLQVWKRLEGKWLLFLDVFLPIPEKK